MSHKQSLKDRYPDDFARARDILMLAQARLVRNASTMTRAELDKVMQACGRMALRRPRGFNSLVDACMILAQHSDGDSLSHRLRQFQDIIDDVREKEARRPKLVPPPEEE